MPLPQRRFHGGDEELGKKDDDHKVGGKGHTWQQRRIQAWPRRSSLKKFALGTLVVIGFYYFFKNMPTDLEQPRLRPSYGPPAGPNAPAPRTVPNRYNSKSRTTVEETEETPAHNFNGVRRHSSFYFQ